MLCMGVGVWWTRTGQTILYTAGNAIGVASSLNGAVIVALGVATTRDECPPHGSMVVCHYLLMVLLLAVLCVWGIGVMVASIRFL